MGPEHPSIAAELLRLKRSARVRMGLSLVAVGALFWGLHQPARVVGWAQASVLWGSEWLGEQD